jgi:hypothetical protein
MIDGEEIVEQTGSEQSPAEDIQSNPEKQPNVVENTPIKQPNDDRERNLAALRMQKEQAQRERDEMAMRLRDLEEKFKPKTNEPDDDFSLGIGESDLVEGKHLSKMAKQQIKQQKELREEMAKTQQQLQTMIVETRIKAECPDIDKVVTKENMEMLASLHPEIAETIKSSNNYYSQAKTAYKLMKQFGIYKEDTYGQDRERAQANAKSPKPLASISPQAAETPLSHANAFANGLTEELKAQLRKEMEEAIRNY